MFYLLLAIALIFIVVFFYGLTAENKKAALVTIVGSGATVVSYSVKSTAEVVRLTANSAMVSSDFIQDAGNDTLQSFNSVGEYINKEGGAVKYGTKKATEHMDDIGVTGAANSLAATLLANQKSRETGNNS